MSDYYFLTDSDLLESKSHFDFLSEISSSSSFDGLPDLHEDLEMIAEVTTKCFIATQDGDYLRLEAFLKAGANPNSLTKNHCKDFYSCLQMAVERQNYQIVNLLIRHKANPDVGRSFFAMYESPLTTATKMRDYQIMELLLEACACPDSISIKSCDKFKILETSLHHAAKMGDEIAVDILLKNGAQIDLRSYYSFRKDKGYDGPTALYYAVGSGNWKIVKALVDRGADPNAKIFNCLDGTFSSPIRRAEMNDDSVILNILILM